MVFFKAIGEKYNGFLEDLETLDLLKADNKKTHRIQLYIYPLISIIGGTIFGYLIAPNYNKQQTNKTVQVFSIEKNFIHAKQNAKGLVRVMDKNKTLSTP